jgi:hypothetical protein
VSDNPRSAEVVEDLEPIAHDKATLGNDMYVKRVEVALAHLRTSLFLVHRCTAQMKAELIKARVDTSTLLELKGDHEKWVWFAIRSVHTFRKDAQNDSETHAQVVHFEMTPELCKWLEETLYPHGNEATIGKNLRGQRKIGHVKDLIDKYPVCKVEGDDPGVTLGIPRATFNLFLEHTKYIPDVAEFMKAKVASTGGAKETKTSD